VAIPNRPTRNPRSAPSCGRCSVMRRRFPACPPRARPLAGGPPRAAPIAVFSALPGEVDLAHSSRIIRIGAGLSARHRHHLEFHAVKHPATELLPGAFASSNPPPPSRRSRSGKSTRSLPGIASIARRTPRPRTRFYDRILAAARPDALKIGVVSRARSSPTPSRSARHPHGRGHFLKCPLTPSAALPGGIPECA